MSISNEMKIEFDAKSQNEGFARISVAAFFTQLDPTLEEIADIKTAISEAVTNAIIHGYEKQLGKVEIYCYIEGNEGTILVKDQGRGIEDIKKAMEPLYTTKPELDRSGMGFAFMEAFMDDIVVESDLGKGTTITMKKKIGSEEKADVKGK